MPAAFHRRLPARAESGHAAQRINSLPSLFFNFRHPMWCDTGKQNGLPESCSKNRRRTEVPGSSTGSADAVGRHDKLKIELRFEVDAWSVRRFRTSARCLRRASLSHRKSKKTKQTPSILQAPSLLLHSQVTQ
jgi:hypothetical protein